jgi:carboxylesterase
MNEKLMPGGEPFFYKAGKVGCLLVHGFTGTPSSLQPMGEYLAGKGITTLGVRLKGHGTSVEDMHKCSYQDWIDSARQGLIDIKEHCDKVFISGLSMGGALTLYLSSLYPEEIKGLIPICAPVFMKDPKMALVPVLKYIIKTVPAIGGNLKDPAATEITYDKTSVPAAHQLVLLLKKVKSRLPDIKQPALIFQSREDAVVPPVNAPYILENIGSPQKELIWLENSYHVATLDFEKEMIFEKTVEFINSH